MNKKIQEFTLSRYLCILFYFIVLPLAVMNESIFMFRETANMC
jgi:hypothetical protein